MPGVADSAFEAALSKRVTEVLSLPGWTAAQSLRVATPPAVDARQRLPFPKYMVIWETEASHPQELQDRLIAATKAGEVKTLGAGAEAGLRRAIYDRGAIAVVTHDCLGALH